jgi:hypothetical protein
MLLHLMDHHLQLKMLVVMVKVELVVEVMMAYMHQ